MNTSTDYQEAEKKSQALLRFALGNHNAKRYNVAAGLYELILKRYPDTEAAKFAQTNLNSLVNKIDGVKAELPENFDEILIARIEQSTGSEPVPNPMASMTATQFSKPESNSGVSPATPDPGFQPAPAPVVDRTALEQTTRQRKLEAVITDTSLAQPVVVVDIHMRFWSMVWFMVKAAFAAIPALIITTLIMFALIAFLIGFFKSFPTQ